METLVICRICLIKDVQHVVKDLQLQETYERMTTIPFQRALRPLALCYICFAQLKASHRFKLKCLKAEELLAQMLDRLPADEDKVPDPTLIDRSALNQLTISSVEQKIIDITFQDVDCKVEFEYEHDVKLEEDSTPGIIPDVEVNDLAKLIIYEDDVKTEDQRSQVAPITEELKLVPVVRESVQATGDVEAEASNPKRKYDKIPVVDNKIKTEKHFKDNNMCRQKIVRKRYLSNANATKGSSVSNVICLGTEKIFICDMCKISFSKKSKLIQHACTRSSKKLHVCHVCEKSFTKNSYLKLHARTHTGERPYVCNMCEQGFRQMAHLKMHERTHTGVKPYVCNVCGNAFTRKAVLEMHALTHTGEKPYVCNICEKGFTEKTSLKMHARSHTGERPYVCNVCEKSFGRKAHLIRHARTHTCVKPCVCNVCEKGFGQKADLVRHARTHTGEKPHVCSVCEKAYSQKADLIKHARLHND